MTLKTVPGRHDSVSQHSQYHVPETKISIELKWNSSLMIYFIIYICAFPTVTCQYVFSEKAYNWAFTIRVREMLVNKHVHLNVSEINSFWSLIPTTQWHLGLFIHAATCLLNWQPWTRQCLKWKKIDASTLHSCSCWRVY